MGHFCNVTDNDVALDILAHRKGKLALCVTVLLAVDKLTQGHHFPVGIWHLDTDTRLARHRCDTNAGGSKVKGNIL